MQERPIFVSCSIGEYKQVHAYFAITSGIVLNPWPPKSHPIREDMLYSQSSYQLFISRLFVVVVRAVQFDLYSLKFGGVFAQRKTHPSHGSRRIATNNAATISYDDDFNPKFMRE